MYLTALDSRVVQHCSKQTWGENPVILILTALDSRVVQHCSKQAWGEPWQHWPVEGALNNRCLHVLWPFNTTSVHCMAAGDMASSKARGRAAYNCGKPYHLRKKSSSVCHLSSSNAAQQLEQSLWQMACTTIEQKSITICVSFAGRNSSHSRMQRS